MLDYDVCDRLPPLLPLKHQGYNIELGGHVAADSRSPQAINVSMVQKKLCYFFVFCKYQVLSTTVSPLS